MRYFQYIFLFLLILLSSTSFSQTTTVTDFADFSTENQPMFGNGFNLNFEQPIFHEPWSSSFGPSGGIADPGFGLGQYGFEFSGGTYGHIGAKFYSRNWFGGEVDVDYPVDVTLTYPSPGSFERGEIVTINSDYTLRNTANIATRFPESGNVGLEMDFLMRFWLNPKICFYSCVTPGFDTGNLSSTLTLFDVDANEVTYACPSPTLTCSSPILPFSMPANNFGFDGEFDLPYVNTTSQILPNRCLNASGRDNYAWVNVDVFDLIGGMNIPYVSAVLANLDGGDCYLGGNVCWDYTLLSATFGVYNDNTQDFDFCPRVYSKIGFPSPVEYTVTDPLAGNALVQGPGQSDTIRFVVGHDVNIKYPCNFEFMDVSSKHDIENDFSNVTEDEIRFDFTLEAMSAGITIQGFSTPGIRIDLPCVFYYFSCSWSGCSIHCGYDPPPFWAPPPISLGPWSFGIGPLYSQTWPLGSLPGIPWYNNTWELDGFEDKSGSSFQLRPREFKIDLLAKNDVSCFGLNDGSMQVQLTNGTAPFTYHWSDGVVNTLGTNTEQNNSLFAGNQFVLVEDANGCEVVADAIIIEPLNALEIENFEITNVDCFGNSTGLINASVVGGNSGYVFNWTPNVSVANIASNIPAGNYQLDILDSKNCTTSGTFVVDEPAQLQVNVTTDSVRCKSEATGKAYSEVSGGIGPYTYLWSNGSQVDTAQGLIMGTHNLLVSDANGCSISTNFIVEEPALNLTLTSVATDVRCYSGTDGAIDVFTTGGTAPYTYSWFSDLPSALSSTSEDLIGLSSATYTAFVTDARGCKEEIATLVDQPSQPLTSSLSKMDVLCYGGNTGTINVNVTGGTPNYSFLWNNGAVTQNLASISVGNYVVLITDNLGCQHSDSIEINQPDSIYYDAKLTDVNCFGENTGAIDFTIYGGILPFDFSWNNASTTEDVMNINAGNYIITATDDNGCSVNQMYNVTQPIAPLLISSTQQNISCFDGSNGEINVSVIGGTLPYYYSWSNEESILLTVDTAHLIDLSHGQYHLIVVDENGCEESHDVVLVQPDNPLNLSLSKVDVLCRTDLTGSVNSNLSGGTIPYNYQWNSGEITGNLTNVAAGNYVLSIFDNNNCTIKDSIVVEEPESELKASMEFNAVKCKNGEDGSAKVIPYGGIPNYNYLWANGAITPSVSELSSGYHSVTVTDSNQCTYLDSVFVTQPNTTIEIDTVYADSISCHGFSDGSINILAVNGTTPYKILYGDSVYNLFNNNNNYDLLDLSEGTYHITVLDNNGCSADTSFYVPEPDTISHQFTILDADCFGAATGEIDLTVFGGSTPYSYFWSNGQTNQDITSLLAAKYKVVVLDKNNCQYEAFETVGQPDEIVSWAEIGEVTCRDNNDGTLSILVTGGTPGYSYLWSNSEVTEEIYDLLPGLYYIEILDNHGCLAIDSFYVNYADISCINPPTVFTPDGDGINETWILDDLDLYPDAVVQVFNKWGQLLYETKGEYTPWNGSYNGNILPPATYYYVIELNNDTAPYTGTITILRDN